MPDLSALPTPCYVTDQGLLTKNLEILAGVQERCGCKILLAQKAFSMHALYPLIGRYLSGTAASSLFEARLGREHMGGETHIYAPAYQDGEFDEITRVCGHVVFNSFAQWRAFGPRARAAGCSCGIRVNPGYSEIRTALYNPCAPGSRFGVTPEQFERECGDAGRVPEGVEGLHFHTLCEQGADVLERTLERVEEQFGKYLRGVKWLNMGGGHHITRGGYDVALLERLVKGVQDRYGIEVYLEPGEAVALDAGFLYARVLDITENGGKIAILDVSAACHMPDVLEMPYRPEVENAEAGNRGEYAYDYRLAGPTCLAGDVIGEYSFKKPLKPGDMLVFRDMAIYTMVKNNTFNGVPLPSIAIKCGENIEVIKRFGYEDFKTRLS